MIAGIKKLAEGSGYGETKDAATRANFTWAGNAVKAS